MCLLPLLPLPRCLRLTDLPAPTCPLCCTSKQGYQAVFDVSEGQLDALAGSDTLKAEVITQGEHRSSDKSLQRASSRLLSALMAGETPEQRLAMPLLVLLAQQRKLIVLQSQVGWWGQLLGVAVSAMGEAGAAIESPARLAAHLAIDLPTLPPCNSPPTSSSLLSCTTNARRSAPRCVVLVDGFRVGVGWVST